ncbi:LRR repeats and ubiquitin-like domain-containing protein At2g30105 isoform X2 [Alnus glutinosa]|uniref:LRR repeats and ubiquitin-like domain-containing protein At2g30105 isoform X2 n=1 Tax=Alnus glutinosa TaxID=3517 RepID=UPI002D76706F|nr:LRR repeats and ubiquitin-like domain-containing protein At2g30105 isoform X2 [Alnus glutinosa]
MEEAGVTTGEANDPQSKATGITITVKFSGRSIPVTLSPDATIGDLKSILQPLTNVLPRGQKLIFKGKLLVDTTTLRASEVTGGAKVMLMASQGLHQGEENQCCTCQRDPQRPEQSRDRRTMEEAGATTGEANDLQSKTTGITITIKFSGRSIPVTLSLDATIGDLKSLLQPLTNVLPRGQKLIFKGKLLVDTTTLRASEVTGGAKVMLMASQGLHQGDGPILKEARSVPRRVDNANRMVNEKTQVRIDKNRLERWKVTRVVALSECNLKAIPDEVWSCGPSARVLDLSNNSVRDVPAHVGRLSSIQKLLLNANAIMDESINWEALTSLKYLTVLSVNQNQISTIPACIGDCNSLIEVDLSSNLLSELPETFGHLHDLKALYVSNNGLKSLPSTLFKMCLQLSTLDLHNTQITMDLLRQFEGWESFDQRRLLKHQKQLDFRVVGSAEFDEGADKN